MSDTNQAKIDDDASNSEVLESKQAEGFAEPKKEPLKEPKVNPKYPMNCPMAGHSAFLQKRLAKGQKYFDSGDYQMARQRPMNKNRMPTLPTVPTGEAIPTPDSVPVRKTSIIQQNKIAS